MGILIKRLLKILQPIREIKFPAKNIFPIYTQTDISL